MSKCLYVHCKKEARKGSKYCCEECRIAHFCLVNPRPSSEEIERKTILTAYLNCAILPNVPDKNLKALHFLLENALKIGEVEGISKAKQYLKTQIERIKNGN